jgi:hypothetical protein
MPVLSLIGCKILEDEITHVLLEHRQNSSVILIDDLESMELARKLRSLNIPFSKAPFDRVEDLLVNTEKGNAAKFISRFFKQGNASDLVIVVKIMELGLHRDHHLLREGVEHQIIDMSKFSDGIFLFYGLCGNSLKGIEEIEEDLECELYFPTDSDGNIVDDCISIAAGGNKIYDDLFRKCSGTGTLFLTPMWASKWDFAGDSNQDMLGQNCNAFFTEKIGKLVKLDTGLHYEKDFNENILALSKHFNSEVIKTKGSTEIVDTCYPKVRDEIIEKSKRK